LQLKLSAKGKAQSERTECERNEHLQFNWVLRWPPTYFLAHKTHLVSEPEARIPGHLDSRTPWHPDRRRAGSGPDVTLRTRPTKCWPKAWVSNDN